ncbi:DUF3618 domain-containing protein [Streptomyces iakyrus]|uniref:DUF3618 domain-containing protein n=1 Tax=Streptomyces iakyrus TaxID=68219 RepID=UPI00380C2E7D
MAVISALMSGARRRSATAHRRHPSRRSTASRPTWPRSRRVHSDDPAASRRADGFQPGELREQVEETRQSLGKTVEALAARTDVKAKAQEKAADVKQQAARTGELKAKAAEFAHQVQDKLPDPVKDKAAHTADQARARTVQVGRLLREKAPEPVRRKAAQGARAARDDRALLLAAGVGAARTAGMPPRQRVSR